VKSIDVTGLRVDAQIMVSASAAVVWELLADITNVGRWSPECVHTAWLDQAARLDGQELDDKESVRPGVRFSGRNRSPDGFEWSVTCEITEADRPRTFAWIVLDDSGQADAVACPSSRWRYDLEPAPHGGTLVRHSFAHGPGDSGLRWMMRRNPDRTAEIIEGRRRQLHGNMQHSLAAMKAAAEQPAP
jgi:uncharacterized protein YndB with AHSA1/START domain